MIRVITLTPSANNISGGYISGDTVLVKCDATDAAFTAYLPSAPLADNVIFEFIKTDSSANVVTIAPVNNETINGVTSAAIAAQYNSKRLVSDKNNWIDFNTGTLTLSNITDNGLTAGKGVNTDANKLMVSSDQRCNTTDIIGSAGLAIGNNSNAGVNFYDGAILAANLRWFLANNPTGDGFTLYKYTGTGSYAGVALTVLSSGSLVLAVIKSGATQAAAGAVAGELWKTSSHATLPDNVVLIGV